MIYCVSSGMQFRTMSDQHCVHDHEAFGTCGGSIDPDVEERIQRRKLDLGTEEILQRLSEKRAETGEADGPSRRTVLRGAAGAAAAGVAAPTVLSGEAEAHGAWQPVYTYTELNIREGPSLSYDVIKITEDYVGFRIEDGPWDNDGYRWWLFRVNSDNNGYSRIRGYAVDEWTAHPNFAYPTWGYVSSTYWDTRDNGTRYHRAIDIANDHGTNIYAARGGTVSYAGWASGYGYVVYIDHGYGYQTRYAHLSNIGTYEGATVDDGEYIGDMGCTGSCSGTHLHFEIREDGYKKNWPMRKYARLWLKSAVPKNFSGISGAVYP